MREVKPEDNLPLIAYADKPKFEHVLSGNLALPLAHTGIERSRTEEWFGQANIVRRV
jgi:hypothetical protein